MERVNCLIDSGCTLWQACPSFFFLFECNVFNLYVYVFVYVCLHVYRYLRRLEGVGSLELELLADVNHLTWVLGTELGSSGRAARAANH